MNYKIYFDLRPDTFNFTLRHCFLDEASSFLKLQKLQWEKKIAMIFFSVSSIIFVNRIFIGLYIVEKMYQKALKIKAKKTLPFHNPF